MLRATGSGLRAARPGGGEVVKARVDQRIRGLLRRVVGEVLAERRGLLFELDGERGEVEGLTVEVAGLRRELGALRGDLELLGQPFLARMTMDQAWRRHPGAAAVFARHHLPACDGCAVRFDETVEEAASAYGLDLGRLLAELNALLPGAGAPSSR